MIMRVLSLEDDAGFVELLRATLDASGQVCQIDRVESEAEFVAALQRGEHHIILADYSLPDYDGLSALKATRLKDTDVPFIFVSGFLGEDVAIESLRSGATDYVLKSNLSRLVPAMQRALAEASERRQRRDAERALRHQAELLNLARDAIVTMDLRYRVQFWNRGAESVYGWTAEEAVGREFHQLCGMEAVALDLIRETLLHTEQWAGGLDQSNRRKDPLTVDSRWTLVRDALGTPSGMFMLGTDITERKRLETQFLRSQRLESVGTLASGIAHDLNNVLTPITMSIQLFRDKLTDPHDQELLKNLEVSARRGADIIRQVLTFTRGVEGPLEPVEMPRISKEIVRIISETFPRSVQIESRIPRTLWLVRGLPTQLYQVLMNLCVNARDAMPQGGRLSVRLENRTLSEREAAHIHVAAQAGNYVVLTVADTGIGMTREVQDRMFDPFFTTKEKDRGTGLGLSTVHKIISDHHGFIVVESAPGRGTTLEVFIPACPELTPGAVPGHRAEAPATGSGELVLVVDDEAAICRFAVKVLQKAGYRCLCAGNGQEGIELFNQHRDEVRLVVTDMMMPVMGGDLIIRAMMQQRPDLRFIAMSGFVEQDAVAGLPKDRVTLLPKPFEAEHLLQEIRKSLDAGQPGPLPGPAPTAQAS